jgi:four helix bundle protein
MECGVWCVMSGEGAQGFEKLEVYRRGLALIPAMYALAQRFPAEERRGLSDQMRRACRSVTANIAEGYGRRSTPKEFCRYLSFAVGSANEMEAHLDAARVLGSSPKRKANDTSASIGS